jgi:hypothetical protein
MSATTKHDFHPDAESLNALAEHALAEKERGLLLAHLAVCERCRQVLALARQGADAEIAAPVAGRHVAIQTDAWWERWRLVWVPTAVVAAFAVVSISVYVHQTDQNSATIKIPEQSNKQGGAGPANLSQAEQAQAAPPPPPATAMPKPMAEKPSAPGRAQGARSLKHEAPTKLDRLTPANSPQASPSPSVEEQQLNAELAPSEKTPEYAASSALSSMRALRSEQKQRDEPKVQTEVMLDGLPRSTPAPANAHVATGAAAATQQVVVTASNPRLELQTESLAGFGAMKTAPATARSMRVATSINLPSGQPATSTVAIGRRMLAVDKTGALFLSEDAGNTWEQVTRQWTGRAIMVRRHTASEATTVAAPTTVPSVADPGDGGGSPAATTATTSESTPVPAPAPPVFFEVLNDRNQIWLSTDGRLWIAQ